MQPSSDTAAGRLVASRTWAHAIQEPGPLEMPESSRRWRGVLTNHLQLRLRGGGEGLAEAGGKGKLEARGDDEEWWEGGVVSWGLNLQGRLGNGDVVDRFRPARSKLWQHVLQVSAGDYHRCAKTCQMASVSPPPSARAGLLSWGLKPQTSWLTFSQRRAHSLTHSLRCQTCVLVCVAADDVCGE